MIVVLTYDAPHRKTQDLLVRLSMCHKDILVLGTPWIERKKRLPLLPFRPGDPGFPMEAIPVMPSQFCTELGISYSLTPDLQASLDSLQPECVLIGGAGILPEPVVKAHPFINIHPGYLPYGRGLDSFKWAILNRWPTGITAHVIDERPDCGYLLFRQEISVQERDTFHSIALRMYEEKIKGFMPAIEVFRKEGRKGIEKLEGHDLPAFRRMKWADERATLVAFEEQIKTLT